MDGSFPLGCLDITYTGNISTLNLPGYTTNAYLVTVELPTTLSPGTYGISYEGIQDATYMDTGNNSTSPGAQDSVTLNDTAAGGNLPYAPCNGKAGMFFSDQAYYPGNVPVPAAYGGYGTVDFEPTPSPTQTPTPVQTPTPGPMKVWPSSIYYPKDTNELTGLGCVYGAQPYVPGTAGQIDPFVVVKDNLVLSTNAKGCEIFEGRPDEDQDDPSVHVHEDHYTGQFTLSGWRGCNPALGEPRWWTKKTGVEKVTAVQNGPDGYIAMWGTTEVSGVTNCTVKITGGNSQSISVSVRPGTT